MLQEHDMAKKAITTDEILEAIDAMEVEDIAKVKEAATEKMASMKHLVLTQFKEDLRHKMSIFGITAGELGFDTGTPAKRAGKPAGERKRAAPTGACPICQFHTDIPHDGRKHRSQGDAKRPFTDAELADLGMTRLDAPAGN